MTKQQAIKLRDEIKADGVHCTIPRGGTLPRIFTTAGEVSFASRKEWLAYKRKRDKQVAESIRIGESLDRRGFLPPPRSPIELMIDKACGIR